MVMKNHFVFHINFLYIDTTDIVNTFLTNNTVSGRFSPIASCPGEKTDMCIFLFLLYLQI